MSKNEGSGGKRDEVIKAERPRAPLVFVGKYRIDGRRNVSYA